MTKGEITEPSKGGVIHRAVAADPSTDPIAACRAQPLLTSRGSGGGGEGEVVVVDDFFGRPSYWPPHS